MGIIDKVFGTYSDREIKKVSKIADKVDELGSKYKSMDDKMLLATTGILKAKLSTGATLDDILPDAFALVREAADRVLGKRPFRVQVIGGILLHQGRIAELKTGEGKTLVAAMPSYLNALTGNGVHVVTVNDYLARVGYEEIGRIHEFLGLKVGLIVRGQSTEEKQAAYNADITYGTNNEFGFDYLRDNMVLYKNQVTQRGHSFAIVDEVDSILIDEARTPLIISGMGDKPSEVYEQADKFARTLRKFVIKEADSKDNLDDVDGDYIVDEKAKHTTLTASGIKKAEKFFKLDNLSDPENSELFHHINQAIKAHGVMNLDTDYVIKDDQIVIVDTFTGRLMPGRRFNDGLHQAIEAKEKLKVQNENTTVATITFQNYFRMYKKLSGMTGTALSEDNEFREIYMLDVVAVPTNKPMQRIDHHDIVFQTKNGKDRAIINQIKECNAKGQPVLVGTVSIEKSEALSKKLKAEGIKHVVLNAKYHEQEAEIVAQAGKLGAVTIATNMAGRGTDILLGGNAEFLAKQDMKKEGYEESIIMQATGSAQDVSEEVIKAREVFKTLYSEYQRKIEPEAEQVRKAGGLFIIGTERQESRRIDNQLSGRSGRQGDPGESRFYLSFEDDLMRLFGSERILEMVSHLGLPEDQPIDAKILSNSIETAQKKLEDMYFNRRKNVLAYDDIMNQQREIIYKQRSDVLSDSDIKDKIRNMITGSVSDAVDEYLGSEDKTQWEIDKLRDKYMNLLVTENELRYDEDELQHVDKEDIRKQLVDKAIEVHTEKEKLFGEKVFREVEKVLLLKNVDGKWMRHLTDMTSLREGIGLQAYAQRDPIREYKILSTDLFNEMTMDIRDDTARMIMCTFPAEGSADIKRVQVIKPLT